MRNANAQTKMTMSKRRNFVNYATMTLANGTVLNLEPGDFRIGGNEFTDDLVDGDNFQVGSVLGKSVTIRLDNTESEEYPDGKFSEYDFLMAYFYLDLHLPDAYEDAGGNLQDAVFRIGKFTVTEPATTGAVIDFAGVDEMYKFDQPFDNCTLDFSLKPTLYQIALRCCNDCGVAVGFSSFDNSTIRISDDYAEEWKGTTYREIISYICQIAGVNARISATGALEFVWYDMSGLDEGIDGGSFIHSNDSVYPDGGVADGGSFSPWNQGAVFDGGGFSDNLGFHILDNIKGLSVSTDDIEFTGVRIINDKEETLIGTDYYVMEIKDNPFTRGYERDIAGFIYAKLQTLRFRPFSCSHLQDPTIEAGDTALVFDVKGNIYRTIITNVTYTTNSYMTVSCNAQSPVKQAKSYSNPAAKAVAQSREYADKQLNSYEVAVDHFNEIATNALGYHRTDVVESGATITYLHDGSTLASSNTIVKITGTGVFISEDGGNSYTSGYDTSTATMLMNLLYVQGITAGYIQDKKGNFFLDLDNGTLNGTFNSLRIGTRSAATENYADEVAQTKADEALESAQSYTDTAMEGLDQDEVFNRLTNNLAEQGLYMINGTLYINSTYIQTGTLKIGGSAQNPPVFQLLNENDYVFGEMNKTGIHLTSGIFDYTYNGIKKVEITQSLLNGYYRPNTSSSWTQYGFIDLAANYVDGYRHIAVKGLDYLHLQAGTQISFEIGTSNTQKFYIDSNGLNSNGYFYEKAATYIYEQINGTNVGVFDSDGYKTQNSKAIYGTYYSNTGTTRLKIDGNVVTGYRNGTQNGYFDMAPYYGDGYTHSAVNGGSRLHLQASAYIYAEINGTQRFYVDSNGEYITGRLYTTSYIQTGSYIQTSSYIHSGGNLEVDGSTYLHSTLYTLYNNSWYSGQNDTDFWSINSNGLCYKHNFYNGILVSTGTYKTLKSMMGESWNGGHSDTYGYTDEYGTHYKLVFENGILVRRDRDYSRDDGIDQEIIYRGEGSYYGRMRWQGGLLVYHGER